MDDEADRESLPRGFRTLGYPGLYLAIILAMLVGGPLIALAFALFFGLVLG